jgi:hypothetical protein
MKKFNLKEHIAKNKATFFSSLNENASNTAEKFAQHMSKKEGKKFTVTPGSVDEKSFDLDVDGEKYMGGSYLVKDNGDIVNVAMGNKVSGNVNQLEEGDLMKNIGKGLDYESTEEMIRDYASGLFGDTYEPEDLADFYLQNPSAFPKSLDHEFFKNNYDDILSLAMTGLDEGKAAYEYEEGKKAGEAIEKKKMKKSELKAKIKEMIVAEMNIDVTDETGAYDFLAELEGMLNEAEGLTPLQDYVYQYEIEISGEDEAQEFLDNIRKLNTPDDVYDYYAYERDWQGNMDDDLENIYKQVKRKFKNLSEAEEEIEDEVEVDIEEPTSEPKGGIDVSQNADADLTGIEKQVQDNLEAAMEAAKQLNDEKLQQQIGNSLTFFTRQHVVKENLNESMFLMLKKILK